MTDADSTSQTALHHACDHSSWSIRIAKAAEELARLSPPSVINTWSSGYAQFFTPLLFICDGAGRNAERRCLIAKILIERAADIEQYDQHGNTPFLLAASSGNVDMLKYLFAAGADIHAKNYAGCGARGRCLQSPGTAQKYLRLIGVGSSRRQHPPTAPRGKSNGASQRSRFIRSKAHSHVQQSNDPVSV